MKRQRGELKKCSRYEPKREKEDCLLVCHRTHGFSPMFLMPMATSFTIRTASRVSLVCPSNLSSCPSSPDGQGLPQMLYRVHHKSSGIGHKNPRWAEEHTTKASFPGGGAQHAAAIVSKNTSVFFNFSSLCTCYHSNGGCSAAVDTSCNRISFYDLIK